MRVAGRILWRGRRRRGARLWHGAHDAKLGPHEPALPHVRLRDPGDIGTLTEEMRMSGTSDYRGYQWPRHMEDEDEGHPIPLVMKRLTR